MTTRNRTAVDELADAYLDASVAHDPVEATNIGVTGHDDALPDYTPDWYAERARIRARALADVRAATPADDTDRVTVAALGEDLELGLELRAAGVEESALNNLSSPLQYVREVFDLMPTDGADAWATISRRLAAVPTALAGYRASLHYAAERGHVAPARQVRAGIDQCADNVGKDGFFATLVAGADGVPDALRDDLGRTAQAASEAYDQLAGHLRDEVLPRAPERDAVGRELYALFSRAFVGARIDLDDAYAWGQDEVARITAELATTADTITPGSTPAEAIAFLDASPRHRIDGTDALQAWMQDTADAAIAALADTHFDIPEPIRRIECCIAPTQQGGIYYTGPSEDLVTRPGRMWWSVPKGVTQFGTWRERTTVYHEGVPGHHLQIAQTVYRRDLLNRWRRLASWTSGHGEGWALYAEQLMAELGFLDDPGDYFGLLDSQSLRAARVVLDIGVHCELPAPAEVGGGAWDYDKAWRFLDAHSSMDEGFRRFELDRYLGLPGQAPAYKLGERTWLELRDAARQRAGAAFDLKAFHRRALDIGSVGLDVLRAELAE